MTVLAIDIGGTKLAAALVRPDGKMVNRREKPTGSEPLATLYSVLHELGNPNVSAIGIGSAGPLDPLSGTISPVTIPSWRRFPLVDAIGVLYPGLPITLAGDAQCMALGEWWRGTTSSRSPSLLGVVVSTGVGGGLVLDGAPYLGRTGNAGHIGHVIVDPAGEPCPCGSTGCLETIASGPNMVRWAIANGWGWSGRSAPDARALAQEASRGNRVAQMAFQRAAHALAAGIISAAALCDLDTVILGGGVSAAGATLLVPVRQAVAEQVGLTFLRGLRINLSSLKRDAGLYGAAALALTHIGK